MCPLVRPATLFVGFSHAFILLRFPAGPSIASPSQKMQELLLQISAIAGSWHSCSCLGFIPIVLSLCNPGAVHLLSQGSVPGEGSLILLALMQASQQQREVETGGCKIAFITVIST